MDYNKPIIRYLETFTEQENNVFKKKAYKKVIDNIRGIKIEKIEDISNITGIGEKIKAKIQYVIDNHEKEEIDEDLTIIYGIGPAKLKTLHSKGIKTIKQLEDEIINDPKLLNDKQKIGLKYYKDIEKRIPYDEITEHEKLLKKIIMKNKKVEYISIVGSYRRKLETSGDIDLLIKIKDKNDNLGILNSIVDELKKEKYILEVLANKDKKFMGIVTINGIARRLDMLITIPEEFPYAELYFTGTKEHNIKIRNKARELGYTLNEHRLEKIKTDVKDIPLMKSEKDIFTFLNMEYLEPTKR